MGVTGARASVDAARRRPGARVRALARTCRCVWASASPPAHQAAEVAAFADGVIVGSALVRCLLDSPDAAGVSAVAALAQELAAGVRQR